MRSRIWESTEQLGRMAEALRRRPADPWARPAASAQEHAAAMAPVAEAFVLGFESQLVEASIPKEKVARYVSQQPDKFIGFAGIDPTVGHPVEELDEAFELGLRGVTVSPVAQGFHPADTRAMELFEACEKRGVPVFVETGIALAREAPLEFGQPHLLDEVARTFPNLRMVLSALAHPWIEQGLALVGKHPTVYGEFSDLILRPWQLYNGLALAHQLGVMSQLLFGSGFPFCTPEKAIVTVYSVNTLVQGTHLPSVPREQLRSVVERDALKCLGLKRSAAQAAALEQQSNNASQTIAEDATR
ncbi:MAG: amidohydrolase family protein [Phycisphaeraceae bacterium]